MNASLRVVGQDGGAYLLTSDPSDTPETGQVLDDLGRLHPPMPFQRILKHGAGRWGPPTEPAPSVESLLRGAKVIPSRPQDGPDG